MAKKYDASDIDILETDRERVQQQAHIYIPDKRLAGALHIVREIIDNAQDEVMNSSGVVDVLFDEVTREVEVRDNGRGIPLEKLAELCEVLNSSGKFAKGKERAYTTAGGLHGLGQKLANFLSEYFIITSMRDGKSITRKYEDGLFIKEKVEESDSHGTIVKFKLSDKYLKELDKMKCKHIQKLIEEKTDACPGLITTFKGITKDGTKIKEKYTGLEINQLMKKYMKPTSKTWTYSYSSDDGETNIELSFGYDTKAIEGSNLMGWTNFIYNKEGGTHVDAIPDALYNYFKKYMINNFLSEKDKKNMQIKREDVKLGLCGVSVLLTTKPEFLGQYKEKMISQPIYEDLVEFLTKKLRKMSVSDLTDICKIIRDNIRARESSQRARSQVKKIGNGLSKDRVIKYIPPRMHSMTDYFEVYLTEGESAGTNAEKSRFDFQAIYKLRGKVDNIYDLSLKELEQIPIIEDLSKILGIQPRRRGEILPDRILGLTDADPDGYAIRAGIVVLMACAFPQVIEEGKLYMVEPPLFSFEENGKKKFVSTNRDYITYLQKKFTKENDLYYNGDKLNKEQIFNFLLRNERYLEFLDECAKQNICSNEFTEFVLYNLNHIGVNKSDLETWKSVVKKDFSKQLKCDWVDDHIIIQGMHNGIYEMIELDEALLTSKKTKKLRELMNRNLNNIYGYSINDDDKLSIFDVLTIFSKYKAKNIKRYKGLGEMSASDLKHTCMDLEHQKAVKITTKDIDKAVKDLALWHSKSLENRNYRKKYMAEYVPDIADIST